MSRCVMQFASIADLEDPVLKRACRHCWDEGKEQGNISDTTGPAINRAGRIHWYCRSHRLPAGLHWVRP